VYEWTEIRIDVCKKGAPLWGRGTAPLLNQVRVPAVYLPWANPVLLAFLSFSRMNKLRRINRTPNSDSPRRHHGTC
jgi:hypothetical protein